jgi:AcrR family transcriptional regulator
MSIPDSEAWTVPDREVEWAQLDADAKHERLLCAAGRVFSREGLGAPMPAVAAEAGAGVASLYRQFPSKHELLAALVIRRLDMTAAAAAKAAASPGNRWEALTEMLWTVVEDRQGDDFLGEAWLMTNDHADVLDAAERAGTALEELLDQARQEGRLRADATVVDIRLLFAATRVAKQVQPEAWQRVLALMIDGLDTQRS